MIVIRAQMTVSLDKVTPYAAWLCRCGTAQTPVAIASSADTDRIAAEWRAHTAACPAATDHTRALPPYPGWTEHRFPARCSCGFPALTRDPQGRAQHVECAAAATDAPAAVGRLRVLVTGSRTWDQPDGIRKALDAFLADAPDGLTIVHGACPRGADRHAAEWAADHADQGVVDEPHPADWERLGKRAGPARNAAMVALGADHCAAFIRDGSPGATHCAKSAEHAGIPTRRYTAATTHHTGGDRVSGHLRTALELARRGVPVLPLRAGKVPFGNCPDCADSACGGRPNMKSAGPCACPRVCHAWAAATTDTAVIGSPPWLSAWRQAVAVAYHPAGAGLTVVDLDDQAAIAWARAELPPTKVVATTRGEHWIYHGVMRSANHVRDGVDIKSQMSYARWLGPGTGRASPLPPQVRALADREGEETTRPGGGVVSSPSPTPAAWSRAVATGCRHNDTYVRTGLERGLATIRAHTESGAGSSAYGVARFVAKQHTGCPGPCGLDTLGQQITAAAVSVGVPEPYARRAVRNGLAAA